MAVRMKHGKNSLPLPTLTPIAHVPDHPERTAKKSLEWDVRYQVWTSRAAMLKTIEMQGKRAPHPSDWRACALTRATL